jgi:hypothetical protein
MLSRRQSRLVGVILALTTVSASAAACGGGSSGPATLPALESAAATPSPTASAASPTAPPSPTTSAPTPPRNTRKAELAAATAVVRRYYSLLNAPTRASTANSLAALITSTCKCQEVVQSLRSAIRHREHYVGTGRLRAVRPRLNASTQAQVLVEFDSTAGGLVRSDGSFLVRTRAQRDVAESLSLVRQNAHWRIGLITLVSQGR